MSTRSSLVRVAAFALTFALAGLTSRAATAAAECRLRIVGFVGVLSDGRLVINAEMWNAANGTQLGYLANSTYCKVNATYGSISSTTCQAWQSIATAAMLSARKLYLTADSCTVGNG